MSAMAWVSEDKNCQGTKLLISLLLCYEGALQPCQKRILQCPQTYRFASLLRLFLYDVEILKDWRSSTGEGWNRQPTPLISGGKRHARRDRAYARRHRQGESGATTQYILPHRIRSVRYYRQGGNAIANGK